MARLPDAPWIRDAELNGLPEREPVHCPVCGEECERIYFYKDSSDALGCEICIDWMDADDWQDQYGGDD